MVAGRTDLGGLLANMQVTAVQELPDLHALALKDLALLNALGELEVALLVGLLDGADQLELGGDLGEALLASDTLELGIHAGPLVVLASSSSLQVVEGAGHLAAVQVLEPELGMLALVARGLGKDLRDLDVAFLLGLAREVGVLVGGLRLAGKRGLKVLLGLRTLKIYCHATLLSFVCERRYARRMHGLRCVLG